MAEETYFTFSYSPVPGDDGEIGGLLNTVQETTAKVQGERQIRMLHDLAARAAEARSEDDAYRIAAEVLGATSWICRSSDLRRESGRPRGAARRRTWPGRPRW